MIRSATFDDLNHLVSLAKKFHAVSPLADYKFSPQGTSTYLVSILRDPNSIILMHEHGAISGTILDMPMCDLRYAEERFWYAERDGVSLLRAYLKWLDNEGITVDMFSSIESEDVTAKRVRSVMSKMGYSSFETKMMRVKT